MRWRVSMAGMLGVVLFSGLVLAALRSGSDPWFRTIYTVTAAALLYAAAVARSRGPSWGGFATVGLLYFVLGFGPWIIGPPGSEGRGLNRNLATSALVEYATNAIAARDGPPPGHVTGYYLMVEGRKGNLNGILHSALTILLAAAGGVAARLAATKAGRRGASATRRGVGAGLEVDRPPTGG